jgi:D-3-phosphoglycerate dehydrogenase / 2-oxoglutarate reductase
MPNNTMRALITCEVSNEFISALKTRGIEYELTGWGQTGNTLTQEELIVKAQGCEIVIVEIEDLNKAVIESLPDLKFVGVSRGTPVNVDLEFCKERGIPVVHTPGRNADSVADYCLSMMLDLSRKLTASSRHLASEGWMFDGKLPYLEFRGRDLGNLKIGLFGFGQIGARVAKRLHSGFGSQVYFFDPFVESSVHAKKVKSLDELFETCDIVSLHAPVIPETENSVNRALLRKLGPEGILISSARAKLIVEEDLYQSLANKEIASAAIDVFWKEPIDSQNRWVKLPNAICTPHIAGASTDVVSNHCETILNGIDKWLSTENKTRGLA